MLLDINPLSIEDMLSVHGLMMKKLVLEYGRFRSSGVGVIANAL